MKNEWKKSKNSEMIKRRMISSTEGRKDRRMKNKKMKGRKKR